MLNLTSSLLCLTFISLFRVIECEAPDNDLFSSTSEIEKLFVREKDFVALLEAYKNDIANENLPLTKAKESLNERKALIENKTRNFPDFTQIEGAVNGLYLLQDAFNLNISQFASGNVLAEKLSSESYQSHTRLTYEDVDGIAKISYNRNNYHRAVDWFRAALEVAITTKNKETITKARNFVKTTMKVHDQVLDVRGRTGILNGKHWETNIQPYDEKLRKKKKYKTALKEFNAIQKNYTITFVNHHSSPVFTDQFNRLCKGEVLLPAGHSKDITCSLLHHFNPYLRLGPFKMEDQSLSPYVTVFRDFLAESEMEHYKEYSRHRLFRSEFGGNKQGVTRTSKQTWLHDYNDGTFHYNNNTRLGVGPYIHKEDILLHKDNVGVGISDRITLATGLYAGASGGGEAFQVANYGLGGYYGYHPGQRR